MGATTHESRQTCRGTRTQRVGGARTGPWQRRRPTCGGCDFQLLQPATLYCRQCSSTIPYCFTGRGAVSWTFGLPGAQSVGVMSATTHRMREICLVTVVEHPRSVLTDTWQRRRSTCTLDGFWAPWRWPVPRLFHSGTPWYMRGPGAGQIELTLWSSW